MYLIFVFLSFHFFLHLCLCLTAQYRQTKRGSLGAVTMSQLMKRQLEHQSSAPHNISTWETGSYTH